MQTKVTSLTPFLYTDGVGDERALKNLHHLVEKSDFLEEETPSCPTSPPPVYIHDLDLSSALTTKWI